jgi:predicted amidophosphoribosyltransferase
MDYGYCSDCKTLKEREDNVVIYAVTEYIYRDPDERLTPINREIRKFKTDPTLADKLGECLVYIINKRYPFLLRCKSVIPVPTSDSTRKYNQAALLAEYISERTGITCRNILRKDPDCPPQHTLIADRKCEDITGKIQSIEELQGESVLLIDDTAISCCTMRECARVLRERGSGPICGLVVGRGMSRRHLEYLEKEDAGYV